MDQITRYVKIYGAIIKANFSLIFVYRFNILTYVLATLSWAIFAIVAVTFYSAQATSVAGWTRDELLTLAGTFSIVTGLAYTLFLVNFMDLPQAINSGELDSLLTKPLDSQFLSTTIHFSLANITRFSVGVVVVGSVLLNHPEYLSNALLYGMLLVCAVVILYSIWMMLVTLNFYSRRLDNVIGLLLELFDQTSRTPSDALRLASSLAFNMLLPLFMIVSFPTKALWNQLPNELVLATIATAVSLFIASRKFWQYSLRHYTSASS